MLSPPVRTSLALLALFCAAPGKTQDNTRQRSRDNDTPALSQEARDALRAERRARSESFIRLDDLPGLELDWPDLGTDESDDQNDAALSELPQQDVRYSLRLIGLDTLRLESDFRSLSALHAGRNDPVNNLAQLRRRTHEDSNLIERLLRSKGYYGGLVESEMLPGEKPDAVVVQITVITGPRYVFSDVRLDASPPEAAPATAALFDLKSGTPVEAAAILAAEAALVTRLPEQGYPFASLDERQVVIDHENANASYYNRIDTGALARIGTVRVDGDRLLGEKHIMRISRFRTGDVYDARLTEDLRRALVATGLYGAVSVRPVAAGAAGQDHNQTVDLLVHGEAAPLRTLAAQVGYSTSEGAKVEGSWQHRNLLPPQGAVTLRSIIGTQQQLAAAELRRSNWKRRDRTLGALVQASHEDRKAFEALTFSTSARIERETNLIWQKQWVWSLGVELTASQETDRGISALGLSEPKRTFLIAAAPAFLGFDGTDDLLDPHRGARLSIRGSPELSMQNGTLAYLKAQVDGSAYLPVGGDHFVLAARGRLGTIFGAERERIAPTRRFYAGGGGSVRGYDYQKVGPLDADGDPIGGRSLVEMSIEARYRIGNIGIVPFIDAGTIDTEVYPRFSDLRFGAGLGFRYYTNFGPIRLDLATPLNPRRGDPKVGVYVSIGQAF